MHSKQIKYIAFGIIIFIGLYLRLEGISRTFWLDELSTSWAVSGQFSDIQDRSWFNNSSPLYFIIIYCSKIVFGFSEAALRIPNFIVGVAFMLLMFDTAKTLTKSYTAGLIALFLVAVDPYIIHYTYDLRSYIFNMLIALISFRLFREILLNKVSLKLSNSSLLLLILETWLNIGTTKSKQPVATMTKDLM